LEAVITVGIDLASQPGNTAACSLSWQAQEATVKTITLNVTDDVLLELANTGDKVGIDVPFGWPDAFIHAVTAHHSQQAWPQSQSRNLRLRQTDLFVWNAIGKQPLSVSTDKIGIPALRMASLMVRLAQTGILIDRTGEGRFVEVYPAAALRRWGIADAKKETAALLPALIARAPWLRMTESHRALCADSRDACDALVAALVARAAAVGACELIPEEYRHIAGVEGWIALPFTESLSRLVNDPMETS
jgi:predicted nuclease with RNAse H fold